MSDFHPRSTPWRIDEGDFYEIEDNRAQLEFLVRYAVLAPSGHNTQPWSFRIAGESIEVYADFSRRLPVADPTDRELLMSIGTAITNLRVAAAHFGFESTVLYQPRVEESLPVAVVAVRETCSPDTTVSRLFPAITRRRTNRQAFEEKEIDDAALDALCEFIDAHSETMRFVLPHDRQRVLELIAEGDRQLMSSEAFRGELADWMRPNESSASDGICGDGFGVPGPVSALAPWMMRRFDMGDTQSKHDRDLARHAAGLIVVTADDDRTSLIRAGEHLEMLLLLLTALNIHYSFLNQPIEVKTLRGELWSMIRSPKPPQLLLRIGYGRSVHRPMPRRSVDSVLVK